MEQTIQALIRRYGQRVEIIRARETSEACAFLQPLTGKSANGIQYLPTPLGLRREDRWLYLGESAQALSPLSDRIKWNETVFEIQAAQPIYIGAKLSHWWALLIPEDKEPV